VRVRKHFSRVIDAVRWLVSKLVKASAGAITLLLVLGPKLFTVLIKLLKVAKVGQGALLGSSLAVYSYLISWQFAVLMLTMLMVHEYGHVWAMKRCGMKVRGMYFVPLFGAIAVTEDMFKSRRDECYIAIMGPLWGLGVSLCTYGVFLACDNPFYAAMACWMAVVNIFNLLPILPMDGGRIVRSIGLSVDTRIGVTMVVAGLVLGAVIAFSDGLVLLGVLSIAGLFDLKHDLMRQRQATQAKEVLDEIEKLYPGVPDSVNLLTFRDDPNKPPPITNIKVELIEEDGKTIEVESSEWSDEALKWKEFDFGWLRKTAKLNLKPMTPQQIVGYTLFCLSVFVALYIVMKLSGITPGSEVAMQLLKS
jgi:Zn-dependent protease